MTDLQAQLEVAVATALDHAKALGATQAESNGGASTGLVVSVRLGELETVEHENSQHIDVTVYFDQAKGVASTNDLAPSAVKEVVDKACSIARFTAKDVASGLADPARLARTMPDLELHHPWSIDPHQAADLAKECEQVARDYDPRVTNSDGATVDTGQYVSVYGNSDDFLGGYQTTRHQLYCVPIAEEHGRMERDYWYTDARDPAQLQTPQEVGQIAGERTIGRLGSKKIDTCKTPVLYSAEMARGLWRDLVSAISGGPQYRNASFLLGAAGEKIFPDFVQLSERPHIKRAVGSRPMDAEGVATQDRELVVDGVIQGYVLSSYSARKLGLETTGNAGGVGNLQVATGDDDRSAMLKALGTGFYVTELMGHGANLLTGDYSYGASGFWVENGDIQYPVSEVTIASNLKDMYANLVAIGNDVDERSRIRTGSVLIEEMTVAGN